MCDISFVGVPGQEDGNLADLLWRGKGERRLLLSQEVPWRLLHCCVGLTGACINLPLRKKKREITIILNLITYNCPVFVFVASFTWRTHAIGQVKEGWMYVMYFCTKSVRTHPGLIQLAWDHHHVIYNTNNTTVLEETDLQMFFCEFSGLSYIWNTLPWCHCQHIPRQQLIQRVKLASSNYNIQNILVLQLRLSWTLNELLFWGWARSPLVRPDTACLAATYAALCFDPTKPGV